MNGWIRHLIGGWIVVGSFLIRLVINLIAIAGVPMEQIPGLQNPISLFGLGFTFLFYMRGLLFLFTGLEERKGKWKMVPEE